MIKSIDLIPGGADILVTEENKKKYIKALAQWKMADEIHQ